MRLMIVRVLILIFASVSVVADDKEILEYSWLTGDRISGHQTVLYDSDGTIRINFEYADRGRGPKFESVLRLNDDGVPSRFIATGSNNTKATIHEQFSIDRGRASWRSAVESGDTVLHDSAFYFPHNDSPEIRAVLARALLEDPDHSIALLPGGTSSIKEIASAEVTLHEKSQRVVLYGISGIAIKPKYLWVDDNNKLFGFTEGNFGIIREGWESNFATLKAAESDAAEQYFNAMSDALTTQLSGLTAVTGARIFDSLSGKLTEPATVFIWDGMISAIYFGETEIPSDARVIESSGKTLMPSLWDMHNHVVSGYFLNYLASGVMNVRDMGSIHDDVQQLIGRIQSGRFAGPDIHPMGFIDKRGEHSAPVGRFAESLEDALAYVDFYARRGYVGIKLYSSIEPSWILPITKLAHERGIPVAGHVPAYMSADQAIEAGFDEITHINMVLLNFLGAEDLDTRTHVRFLVPGKHSSSIDVDSKEVSSFMSLMREKDVAHDTTLAVINEMFRNEPGKLSPIFSNVAEHLPAFLRRSQTMSEGYNQRHEEAFARSADTVLTLIAKLHREGVQLLPGTDNKIPGFTLISELIQYAQAGIPINEVLQLATIGPASHMGLDHRLGSVSVGKDAQMYLVDGNPLEDINNLYRVEQVFKGRKMFYAPDLLRAEGFIPFKD